MLRSPSVNAAMTKLPIATACMMVNNLQLSDSNHDREAVRPGKDQCGRRKGEEGFEAAKVVIYCSCILTSSIIKELDNQLVRPPLKDTLHLV